MADTQGRVAELEAELAIAHQPSAVAAAPERKAQRGPTVFCQGDW